MLLFDHSGHFQYTLSIPFVPLGTRRRSARSVQTATLEPFAWLPKSYLDLGTNTARDVPRYSSRRSETLRI